MILVLARLRLKGLIGNSVVDDRRKAFREMFDAAGSTPDQENVGMAVSASVTVTDGADRAMLILKL